MSDQTERVACDYCGDVVPREDATIKTYPGYDGRIEVPLCNDCHD